MKSFVVIGHVDTGKSSFCGHLLVKTGAVSDAEFQKVKANVVAKHIEYSLYSSIMDIIEDEQIRSKTFEFSTYSFTYQSENYVLYDTPGHKTFIRSMIQGLSMVQHELAVIVISARDTEFESSFEKSGQTKEDIILARAFGVQNIVILVNKMDYCQWNLERYNEIKDKMTAFLKNMRFKTILWVPVSAWTGEGIETPHSSNEFENMPSFLQVLHTFPWKSIQEQECEQEPIQEPKKQKSKKAKGCFILLSNHDVITNGYTAIAHIEGMEYPVELQPHPLCKKCDNALICAHNPRIRVCKGSGTNIKDMVYIFETPITIKKGVRIVIRTKEHTIGFGKIEKVQPM